MNDDSQGRPASDLGDDELEQQGTQAHQTRNWVILHGSAGLQRVADAPGGRLHRLEAHEAAREVGLDRTAFAKPYNTDPPLLATERHERVITDAGRARLLRPATTLNHP